eukprot:XP_001704036.1 Hypothetical protein GL50803_88167 [Giardia lamblia ATCC 50803]
MLHARLYSKVRPRALQDHIHFGHFPGYLRGHAGSEQVHGLVIEPYKVVVRAVVSRAITICLSARAREGAREAMGRAVNRIVGKQVVEVGTLHVPVVDGGNLHVGASKGVAKGEPANPTEAGDPYADLAMIEVQLRGRHLIRVFISPTCFSVISFLESP